MQATLAPRTQLRRLPSVAPAAAKPLPGVAPVDRAAPSPLRVAALLALITLLLAMTLLRKGPLLGGYAAGTVLEERASGALLGEVLDYESDHGFANGVRADAYRIRTASDGQERWLSRMEIHPTTRAR